MGSETDTSRAKRLGKKLGKVKKGDGKMKRLSVILLTVVMVLSTLSMPAHAGPPTPADGIWTYVPCIVDEKVAGGNTFLTTTEEGWWEGTFEGTSTEAGKVVIHASGSWSFKAIVSFDEGTVVDGTSGTLEMSVVGSRPDAFTDWQGKWVILSGTDELETLRGQGTWWGPGYVGGPEPGNIPYEGNIHFEP
jgi:hypothetical protein